MKISRFPKGDFGRCVCGGMGCSGCGMGNLVDALAPGMLTSDITSGFNQRLKSALNPCEKGGLFEQVGSNVGDIVGGALTATLSATGMAVAGPLGSLVGLFGGLLSGLFHNACDFLYDTQKREALANKIASKFYAYSKDDFFLNCAENKDEWIEEYLLFVEKRAGDLNVRFENLGSFYYQTWFPNSFRTENINNSIRLLETPPIVQSFGSNVYTNWNPRYLVGTNALENRNFVKSFLMEPNDQTVRDAKLELVKRTLLIIANHKGNKPMAECMIEACINTSGGRVLLPGGQAHQIPTVTLDYANIKGNLNKNKKYIEILKNGNGGLSSAFDTALNSKKAQFANDAASESTFNYRIDQERKQQTFVNTSSVPPSQGNFNFINTSSHEIARSLFNLNKFLVKMSNAFAGEFLEEVRKASPEAYAKAVSEAQRQYPEQWNEFSSFFAQHGVDVRTGSASGSTGRSALLVAAIAAAAAGAFLIAGDDA